MKILGIETSTVRCAAALVEANHIHSERTLDEPHAHAERLLSLIHQVIGEAGETVNSLDAVAVSIGPGSFTGLRIGLSVAKGLCYSADLPIIPVPTLDSLAFQAINDRLVADGEYIVSMLDARRDEVYTASYQVQGGQFQSVFPAQALTTEKTYELLASEKRRVVIMGDAQEKFRKFLVERNVMSLAQWVIPGAPEALGRASSVGMLATQLPEFHQQDLARLEPFYLKEFYTTMQPLQPITSAHS